jgi:hypothetical protein
VNFPRLSLGLGFTVLLGITALTAGLVQTGPASGQNLTPTPTAAPPTAAPPLAPPPTAAPPATAPPTAAPAGPNAGPSASPSAGPRRGRRSSTQPGGIDTPPPTTTPEPPQFDTLDGIWEVELQPIGRRLAVYQHLSITTTGATIGGYLETKKNVRAPMTGTFDGRLISMNVTLPDGTTTTLNGYVETFADMVGIYRANDKDAGTAFTAEHRKKIKT